MKYIFTILAALGLTAASYAPAPIPADGMKFAVQAPPGLLLVQIDHNLCSGFNVAQLPDGRVLALTAAHCTKGASLSVREIYRDVTVENLPAAVLWTESDVAVITYVPTGDIAGFTTTTEIPAHGKTVQACGLLPEDSQYACFLGVWSGYLYWYDNIAFPLATLPARGGFSGGPVGNADGEVFALYSIRLNDAIAGVSPIQPAMRFVVQYIQDHLQMPRRHEST